MKFDLKTILTIGGIIVTLAGFYHSTQMRLDQLEEKVVEIEQANAKILRTVNRRLKKLGNLN